MILSDWTQMHTYILQMERDGLVTRTFRRLDPDRQQTVINAILDEAVERGPTAINVKRIAERAGISIGALYTYFPNREGVLAFAIELCVRFTTDTFDSFRPYLAALPLREALTAYLVGGVEWSKTQTGLIQLFARAAYQGDPDLGDYLVRPIATTLREMIHDILSQAAAQGEIRDDVDLEATTRIIHTLMIAVGDSQLLPHLNTYLQVQDDNLPAERTLEALITLIVRGIGIDETE